MDIHHYLRVLWSLILCILPIPVPLTLLGVNPKVPTPTYMVAEYPRIYVRSMHTVPTPCNNFTTERVCLQEDVEAGRVPYLTIMICRALKQDLRFHRKAWKTTQEIRGSVYQTILNFDATRADEHRRGIMPHWPKSGPEGAYCAQCARCAQSLERTQPT